MKFSELTLAQWDEWRIYLDTCLLPITGLTGNESPVDMALELENLRDWLELIEKPFYGRVVTYPAYHYARQAVEGDTQWSIINQFIEQIKNNGFKYVVIMSTNLNLSTDLLPAADLVLTTHNSEVLAGNNTARFVSNAVQRMWMNI